MTKAELGALKNPSIRWIGQCLVCLNWFEHPKQTAENPAPGGTFCPVCRANNLMAPGVVNFKAEVVTADDR